MTREEVIKAIRANSGRFVCCSEQASCLVDTWVAVGMLKLDEPNSAHQRMVEACRGLDISGRMIDLFATALKNSGLEVVEKKGEL